MSISDKIREAREWGRCVDTLKSSVDSMYEICRIQQNILGCEEAIMFLKHAIRDFHCLIDTIKIEQNWENSEERPMTSIAWEIRGTVSRNSILQKKDKECKIQSVRNNHQSTTIETNSIPNEEEWQVVQRKRSSVNQRNSFSKSTTQEKWSQIPFGRPSMGSMKAPKSAMDLPQTKSSMAKMAYSRQLLFEKQRKILLEKFNRKKKLQQQIKQHSIQPDNLKNTTGNNTSVIPIDKKDVQHQQKAASVGNDEFQEKVPNKKQNSEPPDCLKLLIDQLSDDCEWRAMTEEEDSLAQEEASLKKEIEIEEEENFLPVEDEKIQIELDGLNNAVSDNTTTCELNIAAESENEKHSSSLVTATNTGHYRNPGEIAQLRAKLLSPTKRRKIEELADSENKLKRAEELRIALQNERSYRLKMLHQRVEEVSKKREEIQQRKFTHLETVKERIQRAEENRSKGLEEIIQRGKDDELKIMEINLLNSFEAANQKLGKRYTQIRERNRYEKLVQKVEEERRRKNEENKQQMIAVEQRRKDVEEQRVRRLENQAVQQQQKQSNALTQRTKTMEKYKIKVAQHSHRVNQRKARELEEKQQLLNKIQQKHDKYIENYEQCKKQVRKRAIELSSPRPCHFWSQYLADFNQPLSDLTFYSHVQQKLTFNVSKGMQIQSLTCNRCKTKLMSELHLFSHVLTEQHLKAIPIEQNENNILELNYDFLRNELNKVIGTVDEIVTMEQLGDNSSNSTAMDCSLTMTESQSSVELLATHSSSTETTSGLITSTCFTDIKQIVERNVELFLTDDEQLKLILLENKTANEQQITLSSVSTKTGNAGFKKKRTKLKQRFTREFEFIDAQCSLLSKKQEFTVLNMISKDLKRILINTLMPLLNEFSSKLAENFIISSNDVQSIEKAVSELIKYVKNAREDSIQIICYCLFLETDLFGQLFAFCVRIKKEINGKKERRGNINFDKSNVCNNNSITGISRLIQKSLFLLLFMLNQTKSYINNWQLSGKALKALCELFHLYSQKVLDDSTPLSMVVEATYSGLLVLHILTQFMINNDQIRIICLLFSYLNSNCLFLEFIIHCGKLQTSELCTSVELFSQLIELNINIQKLHHTQSLFGNVINGNEMSICQVLTDFILVVFVRTDETTNNIVTKREVSEPADGLDSSCAPSEDGKSSVKTAQTLSRSSSTTTALTQQINCCNKNLADWQHYEKLKISRTCSMWLYLLCLHAYHQFGRFHTTKSMPDNDYSDSGSAHIKDKDIAADTQFSNNNRPAVILSKCMLSLFNKIAVIDIKTDRNDGSSGNINTFLRLEIDQMLATRMASIFRSILQMIGKQVQFQDAPILDLSEEEHSHLLRECVTAIGYFVRIEPRNQLLCVLGWKRSILYFLCNLPLEYVHTEPHKHFLLPTICKILWNCPTGLETIRGEFCLYYLIDYLKNAIESTNVTNDSVTRPLERRIQYEYAFLIDIIPSAYWAKVQTFFASHNNSASLTN